MHFWLYTINNSRSKMAITLTDKSVACMCCLLQLMMTCDLPQHVTGMICESNGAESFLSPHSVCQGTLCLLWNLEVYYRVHNRPPLNFILNQLNPVTYTIYFRSLLILFFHVLFLSLQNGLFPSGFPAKIIFVFLISLYVFYAPSFLISLIMLGYQDPVVICC